MRNKIINAAFRMGKMNINKHNYEAFFLDYHEGNLSPQQVADLLLFIEQHPELKEEFESFENISLEDFSAYTFENKDSLKKEINAANREEYFIAAIEGTLSKTESGILETFLKQHPQYLPEFELYQKTKLNPENILFKDKTLLKRIPETADNLLISAVEGLLGEEENSFLQKQLSVDPQMRAELALYQQTKLKADLSIVFTGKEGLKQKERKLIPFFYYISGIAAAVLVLFGLFFIFKNTHEGQSLAKNEIEFNSIHLKQSNSLSNKKTNNLAAQTAVVVKTSGRNKNSSAISHDTLNNNPVTNHTPDNLANVIQQNETQIPQQANPKIASELNTSNTVAKSETKKTPSENFLSLGQIATEKLKEKTLSPDVLAMEKKTGRDKKFSGWDLIQVVAKGVSKITGKKVEAKPTYNDEGEVTAYALGAGRFEFSKGKKAN